MDAIRDHASLAKRPRPEHGTDDPALRLAGVPDEALSFSSSLAWDQQRSRCR